MNARVNLMCLRRARATMPLPVDALHALATLALALGAGASAFWTFVATPALFVALGREEAGRAVAPVFPRYFETQAATAVVALLALAGLNALGVPESPWVGALAATAGLGAIASRFWVLPRVRAASRGTPAFGRAHALSALVNLATMAALVAALVVQ